MNLLSWSAFILGFILVGCSIKPELKTEVDPSNGSTVVSTRAFALDKPGRSYGPYDRNQFGTDSIKLQVRRIEKSDVPPTYEIKIMADSQSPRLKIQKENSLMFVMGPDSLIYSPSTQTTNDNEPLTEYFPAFRTEVAVFSNIKPEDLQKLALADSPRMRLMGETRQEEVNLSQDIQAAIAALLPAVK